MTSYHHAPSGQSRYGQLAEQLRERILRGEWSPGESIPAESVLAQSYGVALGTLRQAVALLVESGVLQRKHGKGTFVTKGVDGASMMRFFRFRDFQADATPPRSKILSCRQRPAKPDERARFGLGPTAQVLQFDRLRSLGETPCLLETIVLPLPRFAALTRLDTRDWDDLLYPMYHARCGVVVHRAEDQLSFDQLNATQARRLKLPAQHPCVCVTRQAFDIAGLCIELRSTRGDAFSFEYTAQVR